MFQTANSLNSFQKWKIGSVVREILLKDQDLQKMVSEHIYPCIAPEGTEGSFIVYRRDKYSKETVKQGVFEDDCKLSLTVISDNYDESTDIAEKIDAILTGRHFLIDQTRVRMELADSTEGWEDNKYFQVLLYSIK